MLAECEQAHRRDKQEDEQAADTSENLHAFVVADFLLLFGLACPAIWAMVMAQEFFRIIATTKRGW